MELAEKYVILNALGDQAKRKFGACYLIEHRESGARCVMKAVKKGAKTTLQEDRLKQEATFSFSEAGLPHVLDFYDSPSETILVTAYKEGITLDHYWQTLKRSQQHAFIIQLVKGLQPLFQALADQHIVHADIKPSNILVDDRAETLQFHLIDFGLAIKKNELEKRSILFPLGFAAPELLLNQLDLVNTSTDIYALGILIWRLYTGTLPLTHPNPSIFTNLQLTHPLPDHHALPKGYYSILSKMTAKHRFDMPPNKMPEDAVRAALREGMNMRYQRLDEIIEALEGIPKKSWIYQMISLR